MLIYYGYFLLNIMAIYIYIYKYKIRYSYFNISLLLLLSIYIAGFRDVTIPDTDFFVYKNNYYGLNNNTMTIGYDWLQTTFRYLNLNFNIFLIFFVALSLIIKIFAFKKISKYWILLFYFYLLGLFLTKEMATLRMGFAFGIIIYSVYSIINKKIFKYLLTIFLASLFHKSALLLVPMYFINRFQLNYFKTLLLIFIAIVIGKSGIIGNVVHSILDANIGAGTYLMIKLHTFSNYDDGTTLGLLPTVIIKKLLLVFIGLYTVNRYKNYIYFYTIQIFFNYMIMGILILFIFGDSLLWAAGSRFSVYFSVFELIILGYFVMSFKTNLYKLLALSFAIILVGSKFIVQILKYQDLYIPYHTIFEKWI